MSGAEEYLDGLLHSVEGGSPADTARETEPGDTADGLYAEKEQETKKAGMSEEDDFLKSFGYRSGRRCGHIYQTVRG